MNDSKYIAAFSKALKSIRKSKGMSQEDVAFAANLHPTYISLLETAKRQPSISTLFSLSEAMNVDVVYFIEEVKRSI